MNLRIDRTPVFSHLTLKRLKSGRPFPLNSANVSLWHSAQISIWQGIQALGLKASDRVLVPAYNCGSEIDPLKKAGLVLDYYRVQPNLAVDMGHLSKLCAKPARALFVTHFFGFSQPMTELLHFCDKHGLLLIEDNAHGLYSADAEGRPLGSLGDMGVFSFSKTLPIPDGGALVLKRKDAPTRMAQPTTAPGMFPVLRNFADLTRASIASRLPSAAHVIRSIKRRLRYDPQRRAVHGNSEHREAASSYAEDYLMDGRRKTWRMSSISRAIISHTDHVAVRENRRRNFQHLIDWIEPRPFLRPLLGRLPSGTSPWLFPILADEPFYVLRHLWRAGIECEIFWEFVHPAMPIADFPYETELKRKGIELPVHQCLNLADMKIIAEAVNSFTAGKRT